jgi:hypothetical protein
VKRSIFPPVVLVSGAMAAAILLAGVAQARSSGDCPGGTSGPALTFSPPYWPTMLPAATVGQPYKVTITVSGGSSGQYQWELSPSDLNGSGMTMDHPGGRYGATLTVSGTPTAAGGPYSFMVGVADTDTAGGQICAVFYPTGGARYEFQINAAGTKTTPTPSPAPDWKNLGAFGPLDDEIAKIEKDLDRASRVPPLDSIQPPRLLPGLPNAPLVVPASDAKALESKLTAAETALAADLNAKPTPAEKAELLFVEKYVANMLFSLAAPAKPSAAKVDATKLAAVEADDAAVEGEAPGPFDPSSRLDDAAHFVEQARVQETQAEIAAGDHLAATFHRELDAALASLASASKALEPYTGENFAGLAALHIETATNDDTDLKQGGSTADKVGVLERADSQKQAALDRLAAARKKASAG